MTQCSTQSRQSALAVPHAVQVTFLAAVVLGVVGATVNRQWAFDIWSYLAAVTEFQHSGLAATNSLAVNAGADPFLSPYTLLVGTGARVLGLGSLTAISIAGVLNVVFLLIALYWFATSFVRSTTAGFLLVVATLVLWGVDPWQWAGYFNLSSIGRVAPLGSTFASATGITALGCIQRWLRHDGPAEGENSKFHELRFSEGLIIGPLLVLIIFVGLYPKLLIDRMEPSVKALVAHVEDHAPGFNPKNVEFRLPVAAEGDAGTGGAETGGSETGGASHGGED